MRRRIKTRYQLMRRFLGTWAVYTRHPFNGVIDAQEFKTFDMARNYVLTWSKIR